MTYFNEGDAILCRADGCAADFLAHLQEHQAFLLRYFSPDAHWLDGSLESLTVLSRELDKRKAVLQPMPRAIIDGVIAYCGEIARVLGGGEWAMHVEPPDNRGGPRYFPCIANGSNSPIEFAGVIEDDLEGKRDCRFAYRIQAGLTPQLPVVTWTSHPLGDNLFPPLQSV